MPDEEVIDLRLQIYALPDENQDNLRQRLGEREVIVQPDRLAARQGASLSP